MLAEVLQFGIHEVDNGFVVDLAEVVRVLLLAEFEVQAVEEGDGEVHHEDIED